MARISRATLTSQLEEALRTDIVAGLLEPGQKLRADASGSTRPLLMAALRSSK